MTENVFDASVYLAILLDEPIHPDTYQLLQGSVLSAVNLAEILSKVRELGLEPHAVTNLLDQVGRVESFTESQAHLASELRVRTSHAGLSLGDRACLALAMELGADVYTADRMWSKVDVPCKIHVIR